MDRYERLDLILRWLSERPGLTAAEIARELKTSLRSVFRDLEYLRERGHPIEADRGRGGGLRLHPNWGLGKLFLSNEEGLCILLSLAISEKIGFPMFALGFQQARKRIISAFPSQQKKMVSKLQERIFVGDTASSQVNESYQSPKDDVMKALQSAFVKEMKVKIQYADEKSAKTNRIVEPHALFINWPAWYLLAFDHLRKAPRTFRVDRIFKAEPLSGQFFSPFPKRIFDEMVGDSFGTSLR